MIITARYEGRCWSCGAGYRQGEQVEWSRDRAGVAKHLDCTKVVSADHDAQVEDIRRDLAVGSEMQGYTALGTCTDTTREGRMLEASRLTVTITNAKGEHVTLQLVCRARGSDGWNYVKLSDASFIFVNVDGEKAATLRVKDECTFVNKDKVNPIVHRALVVLWQHIRGTPLDGYRIQSADKCGHCGRDLTDPVSIDRGIGPSCFGAATGSKSVAAKAKR